jgi:hypothetical protein
MQKKIIAYLAGVAAGIAAGFVGYFLLGYVLGYIAFITPFLAGVAFYYIYMAIAKEQPNLIVFILVSAVTVVGGTFLPMMVVDNIIYNELIAEVGALTSAQQSEWDSALQGEIIFNVVACLVTMAYLIYSRIKNKDEKPAAKQNIVSAGTPEEPIVSQ